MMKDIERIIKSVETSRLHREHMHHMTSIDEVFTEVLERNRELALFLEQSVALTRTVGEAFQPVAKSIALLSTELARAIAPYHAAFDSVSAWETSLSARMEALTKPWVLHDHLSESLSGFARISRLSDAVHTPEPYSALVVELVGEELGEGYETEAEDTASERDEAAVRAGFNPELIAFPPDAYSEVVAAAGFSFRFSQISPPQVEGAVDHGENFSPTPRKVFTALEQHLRHAVEKTLTKNFGPKWIKQRVPKCMRQRWNERLEQDRAPGRPVYSAIQYADFMDLRDIICRSDNWRDGFQSIFGNQKDLSVSFDRLHPIRKAIGHSRPLGRADVLTLFSEATRMFSALGIQILE